MLNPYMNEDNLCRLLENEAIILYNEADFITKLKQIKFYNAINSITQKNIGGKINSVTKRKILEIAIEIDSKGLFNLFLDYYTIEDSLFEKIYKYILIYVEDEYIITSCLETMKEKGLTDVSLIYKLEYKHKFEMFLNIQSKKWKRECIMEIDSFSINNCVTELIEMIVQHGLFTYEEIYSDRVSPDALHKLIISNKCEMLIKLMEMGNFSIDKKDIDGNTPLHIACMRSKSTIIKILIYNGASKNIINSDGKKPDYYYICPDKVEEQEYTNILRRLGIDPGNLLKKAKIE